MNGYRTTNPAEDLAGALRSNQGARDAGFEEGKHPRKDNGQFGSGGGGSHGKEFEVDPKKGPSEEQKAAAAREMHGSGAKPAVTQQSLKARVSAQMDNVHKALGPEKYEVVRKAAYEKNPSPEQLASAEKLMVEAGHGERREPGAMLPKKPMSEAAKSSNAKSMSTAAAAAAAAVKTAKTDTARAAFEEASRTLAEAAQAYAEGDHEKGASLEKKGFYAQFRAEANDH